MAKSLIKTWWNSRASRLDAIEKRQKQLTEIGVKKIDLENGLAVDLVPPDWFRNMLIITLAKMLKGEDGKWAVNWVSTTATNTQIGTVKVIVQRGDRRCPTELLLEAETHISKLLSGTGQADATAFIGRDRTEEIKSFH